MSLLNKDRLFIKSKSIKNITIPFLFIFTFVLVFFNKTDYFFVERIRTTGIDVINPIANFLFKFND